MLITILLIICLLVLWYSNNNSVETYSNTNIDNIPLLWDRYKNCYYVWVQYYDYDNQLITTQLKISLTEQQIISDLPITGTLDFPHSNFNINNVKINQTDLFNVGILGLGYNYASSNLFSTITQLGNKFKSFTIYFNTTNGFLSFNEPVLNDGVKLNVINNTNIEGYVVEFGTIYASKNNIITYNTDLICPKIINMYAVIDSTPYLELPSNIYQKIKQYLIQSVDLNDVSDLLWNNEYVIMSNEIKNSFPSFILTLNSPLSTTIFSLWVSSDKYLKSKNNYHCLFIKESLNNYVTLGNCVFNDIILQIFPKNGTLYIKDA